MIYKIVGKLYFSLGWVVYTYYDYNYNNNETNI